MSAFSWPQKRFWLVYPAWILLCVGLFFVLRQLPDPAHQDNRLDRDAAGRRAIQYLMQSDPGRYRSYEAVHTALSPTGELGPEARWVVLCDRPETGGLSDAMVVELRASDGALIRIRPPVVK